LDSGPPTHHVCGTQSLVTHTHLPHTLVCHTHTHTHTHTLPAPGYLEREAGNTLLALLASKAAPGSRIIMTAPPTPAEQQACNQDAAEDVAIGDGGVRPYRPKLQHTTFEEPTETFARYDAMPSGLPQDQ
jgi:hypothetical protein